MQSKKTQLRIVSKAALFAYLKNKHIKHKRIYFATQALTVVCVFVLTIVLQVFLQLNPPTYKVDDTARKIIGSSRDDTKDYLVKDDKEKVFNFVVPKDQDENAKESFGGKADTYEASLPINSKDGITYTDTITKIGITVTPKFRTGEGKKVEGDHIVYPANGNQLIYTLKYNGLKEDIILPKYIGDEVSYEFELSLPSGVEAKLDEQGNINIYSGDTALYGNINFESDEDRERIDKAREKSEKTNLVATIPSPIVKEAKNTEYTDKASFILGDKKTKTISENTANKDLPKEVLGKLSQSGKRNVYNLKISASNLKDLSYPISIDPTITSSATSDWNKGTYEGNVDEIGASAAIKRGRITSGKLPTSLTSISPSWAGRGFAGAFIYDSKIFYLGGDGDNSIWYRSIANNGTITDVWTQSATLMAGTGYFGYGYASYNGYIYLTGGRDNNTTVATTYYIKIDKLISTTTASSFTAGSFLINAAANPATVAHKGFIYVLGGRQTSVGHNNSVARAQLNGDGSLGAFTNDAVTLNSTRWQLGAFAYNGMLYYGGGCTTSGGTINSECSNPQNDLWATPLKSDGSLSASFVQQTSYSGVRGAPGMIAVNGYAYVIGGCSPSLGVCQAGGLVLGDVQFAEIYADGSLGSWKTTTSLTAGRSGAAITSYNDTLYVLGGCTTSSSQTCQGANTLKNINYAKIDPATGWLDTFSTSSSAITGRYYHSVAVSDGFVYVIGGCTAANCKDSDGSAGSGYRKDVRYATINSNGIIGAFGSGGDIPATGTSRAGRNGAYAVVHAGLIYIVGGVACNTLCTGDDFKSDVLIGKLDKSAGGIVANGMTIGACVTQRFCPASNNMPQSRAGHAAVAHNGWLYVMAGYNGTTVVDSGYYSKISDAVNGDLAAFGNTTSFNSLFGTQLKLYFPMVEYGGALYATGGSAGGASSYNDVQKAVINNSTGALGAWDISSSTAMPVDRHSHAAAVANGKLYVFGGAVGDSDENKNVYIGTFNSSGNITSWVTGSSMISNRVSGGNAGFYQNGRLYFVSGCTDKAGGNCSTFSDNVDGGVVNNGGSGVTNTMVDNGTSINTPRATHVFINSDKYAYIIAGCINASSGCPTSTNTVEKATFNENGSVSAWSTNAAWNISNSVNEAGGVAYNGYLYIIGGYTGSSGSPTSITTVEYTRVNPSTGDLETPGCGTVWCPTTSLPSARNAHRTVVYNGYIYLVGGNGGTNTVLYIKINSNGTLAGSWSTGTSTQAIRNNHGIFVNNGYLYVHSLSNLTTKHGLVESAPLDVNNGSVGSWTYTNSTLRKQYATGNGVVANGFVYLIGGYDEDGESPSIQFAPLLAGGKLGKWQFTVNNISGFANVGNGRSLFYNGRLYFTGGNTGATLRNKTLYFSVQSQNRMGSYSRLLDFDNGVQPKKLITRRSSIFSLSGSTSIFYKTVNNSSVSFTNTQFIENTLYDGANARALNLGTSVTLSRYLWINYIIDDRQNAVFEDDKSEASSLNRFDLYFTANPGKRLKGGRTFTNGADRGLDAAP